MKTWGDLLSLRHQWKTTCYNWWVKLTRSIIIVVSWNKKGRYTCRRWVCFVLFFFRRGYGTQFGTPTNVNNLSRICLQTQSRASTALNSPRISPSCGGGFSHSTIIIITTTTKRTCHFVNFVVPAEHRVKIKESEKKEKYLDLARKLKRLWKMRVMVTPIVIGALETVPRGLKKEGWMSWKSEDESRPSK